ncbi:MAG: orotidine 5'-phosphate decarboxylase, partial [Candidatus Omnitrophica bacterium]|nr:orotidine 5'-phosphate decarboxylase [Candidatus Omnitrophota bacterium]
MRRTTQLIVALDVDNIKEAKRLVDLLYPTAKIFKIGSQLFTACGPEVVSMIGD